MNRESLAPGWCVVSPLPAVAIGLAVMASAGIPTSIWIRNLAAAAAGLLLVAPLPLRRPRPSVAHSHAAKWLVAGGLALLALALAQPGVDGVRRWFPVGPFDLHAAALVLPLLLVLTDNLALRASAAVALLTAIILVLQPDAAQAAAFSLGWIVLAALKFGRSAIGPSAVLALLAVSTILRHDPLAPVAHVEGVVGLAISRGPLWCVGALIALGLPPFFLIASRHRPAAVAIGLYLAATLFAAWLGHFPVPFMGYGVAPILGYYVAILALRYVPPSVPNVSGYSGLARN